MFSGGGRLEPLFELGSDEVGTSEGSDLARYFRVEAADRDLERLARALGRMPGIAGAYVKAVPEPGPPRGTGAELDPAELNAAQGRPGARGEGIVLAVMGSEPPDLESSVPSATIRRIASSAMGTAGALQRAARELEPGDVIAVDLTRPAHCGYGTSGGPPVPRLPLAWWPDDLAAARYAHRRGVLVLLAAGDLGDLHGSLRPDIRGPDEVPSIGIAFGDPLQGFPADWRDPFEAGGGRECPLVVPRPSDPTRSAAGKPISVLGAAAITASLQGTLRALGRAPLGLAALRHVLGGGSARLDSVPAPHPMEVTEGEKTEGELACSARLQGGTEVADLPALQRVAARIESFRNVPLTRLAAFTDELEIDGLVPVAITLDADCGEVAAGSVWAPPTRAFPAETRYAFGLILDEVRTRADEWTREGFRPAAYACTEHQDSMYCSMLWVPLDRARWSGYAEVLGVEEERFEERSAQYAARGFQLQSVERFPSDDGCRVAAVWLVPLRISTFSEPLPGGVHRVPESAS